MSATARRVPGLLRHRGTGQARVVLDGKTFYLGPYGSDLARARYNRLVAQWLANDRQLPIEPASGSLSIATLIDAFLDHADQEYRDADGQPTREVVNLRYPLRLLNETFGDLAATDFKPRDLKLLRERMIANDWCRRLVNQRIGIVRRVFRWAVQDDRLPAAVLTGLESVPDLKRGRGGARETDPVKPVSKKLVRATLPLLTPTLRAMVKLQWWTAMRPGEVCKLRVEEISKNHRSKMGVRIWIADLKSHKNSIRDKPRKIKIGPRGQKAIRRFVKGRTEGYVFDPRVSMQERRALRRASRETPIGPAQAARDLERRLHPKEVIADHYTTLTYGRAIARAAQRAKLTIWSPGQIRHSAATRLRRLKSLETSSACLGHSKLETTQVYSDIAETLAVEAMAEHG